MRVNSCWSDTVPERDDVKSAVWDIAFSPDGSRFVAAAGPRVLVYDSESGDLLHSLKSHKDVVYTVDWSADGKHFASGGADSTVIIWTAKAEGVLKYSHTDTIQKIKFNPVTKQLASCTANDFGLCVVEDKAVTRTRVGARILCCDWTHDGQHLALGLYNGQISIRDQTGTEKVCIERTAPVWSLAWNPSLTEQTHVMAVGCWDGTLSFYQLSGIQLGKDRKLECDPCSVSYLDNGNYLLVAGSDRQVNLHSKDGIKLCTLAQTDDWCWVSKGRPGQPFIASGSNSGTISMHQLRFTPINGLYQDRFAYTEGMTDVVVQHLLSEQKVRIKSRDYVKKVALYKNRLAVQQPDKIVVYELANDADPYDLRYRVRDKIHQRIECDLLVVTSLHVVLCEGKKLQMFDFSGQRCKEWVLEDVIRYMKVVGGPAGREGLLVGLKNGSVLRLFVDNPFPMQLLRHEDTIRCLDLSMSRAKLAVVDSASNCVVYDLATQEEVFREKGAWSAAWNTEQEEMLCFSGNGKLGIKTGDFPVHTQPMQGIVVGFKGSKVFSLKSVAMETIDVPQSASLYRYLEAKDYSKAYKVACLGVTESDWRFLANTSLQSMELDTARKAFIRLRDLKYIELINSLEQEVKAAGGVDAMSEGENGGDRSNGGGGKKQPKLVQGTCMAKILAYQGRFQEAAKIYAKFGLPEKAVDMFSDLRQWEEAKVFASSSGNVDVRELIRRQAEWAEETGEWKVASEMFCAAGQYDKAIKMVGENGCLDELIEVARVIDASQVTSLRKCTDYFVQYGHHQYAKEVFLKMNDIRALMNLHVMLCKWDEAFLLSEQHGGKYAEDVYLPYAQWLAENDRFDEAQAAFKKAKKPEKSMLMLKDLSQSAITEQRYEDAAYYLWLLSEEKLSQVETKEWKHFRSLSRIYYAYATISRYTDEPFSSLEPESVFNASRFLVNAMGPTAPYGLSRAAVLWALGKQASAFDSFKLARHAFDKLTHMRVPEAWAPQIELETMLVQTKPFSDLEEHHFVCYRCSATNPLINASTEAGRDDCNQCGHPFVRSMRSFDLLPLVEFIPERGLSDGEALDLLKAENAKGSNNEEESKDDPTSNRVSFDEPHLNSDSTDAFSNYMILQDFATPAGTKGPRYSPLEVPRQVLKQTSIDEVFVVRWPAEANKRWQFYKNIIPDVRVNSCSQCHSFFHEEDLETACLSNSGKCPCCKVSIAI